MILSKRREKAYKDAYSYLAKLHAEEEQLVHVDMMEKGLCSCPVCVLQVWEKDG